METDHNIAGAAVHCRRVCILSTAALVSEQLYTSPKNHYVITEAAVLSNKRAFVLKIPHVANHGRNYKCSMIVELLYQENFI